MSAAVEIYGRMSTLEYSMTVKLLTEHHLEFLSLKRGYTGLSDSTLVKMPHCWESLHFNLRDLSKSIQGQY